MSLPNSMTIGPGPYENECPENEYRYSLIEIVDDMDITPTEAEAKAGHLKFNIHGYKIEFDYHYDDYNEMTVVNITRCDHGYFRVFNFEIEELQDLIGEKIDLLPYTPEKLDLSDARRLYAEILKK